MTVSVCEINTIIICHYDLTFHYITCIRQAEGPTPQISMQTGKLWRETLCHLWASLEGHIKNVLYIQECCAEMCLSILASTAFTKYTYQLNLSTKTNTNRNKLSWITYSIIIISLFTYFSFFVI